VHHHPIDELGHANSPEMKRRAHPGWGGPPFGDGWLRPAADSLS
jgi:hypothetical protein